MGPVSRKSAAVSLPRRALELLREGVPAEAIQRAATEFGMAIGPLRLMDEIGLDTTLQAGWVLAAAFPERIVSSPLLVSMVKAGRVGQKAGAGFYAYEKCKVERSGPIFANTRIGTVPDWAIDELLARWIEPTASPSRKSIACRLVLPMLLEVHAHSRRRRDCGRSRHRSGGAVRAWLSGRQRRPALVGRCAGLEQILALLSSGGVTKRCGPTPMLESLAKANARFYANLAWQLP